MDNAEQESKRKESLGTNKTRKESSGFLLERKHMNLPVTAYNSSSNQENTYYK